MSIFIAISHHVDFNSMYKYKCDYHISPLWGFSMHLIWLMVMNFIIYRADGGKVSVQEPSNLIKLAISSCFISIWYCYKSSTRDLGTRTLKMPGHLFARSLHYYS